MKEVKFRIWSEMYKQIFDVISFEYINHGNIKAKININGCISYIESVPEYLMQYTGLKDKHEREIYEGDILKFLRDDIVINSVGGYKTYHCGDIFEVRSLESGFMLCQLNDGLPDCPNGNYKVSNYEFWNNQHFSRLSVISMRIQACYMLLTIQAQNTQICLH